MKPTVRGIYIRQIFSGDETVSITISASSDSNPVTIRALPDTGSQLDAIPHSTYQSEFAGVALSSVGPLKQPRGASSTASGRSTLRSTGQLMTDPPAWCPSLSTSLRISSSLFCAQQCLRVMWFQNKTSKISWVRITFHVCFVLVKCLIENCRVFSSMAKHTRVHLNTLSEVKGFETNTPAVNPAKRGDDNKLFFFKNFFLFKMISNFIFADVLGLMHL